MALVLASGYGGCTSRLAFAARPAHGYRAAPLGSGAHAAALSEAPSKAPSDPPLATAESALASGEENASASPQDEADPLVANGLGSPTCTSAISGELSATSSRNCQTSGFLAAPAPTGDYGIDVHIDTGVLGLSYAGLLSTVQDVFVTPVWMACVWAMHALVVMLEWCFTLDLLGSAEAGGLGAGLRSAESTLTDAWLPLSLAVAATWVAYNGLIRRRVADTLGEALATVAMMAAGIWVVVDPAATVGALAGWANQASLGTMAVASRGSPANAGRALGESMGMLFTAGIESPWCYLEFGNVGWCRDPSRLDPAVRAAGLKIAAKQLSLVGCASQSSSCAPAGSGAAKALRSSARLLREARTNGEVFLGLPANGPARNSINEQSSLLRTICGSSDATDCQGADAAEAEFRTNAGTWPRVAGLLLIVADLLGMVLLLGFVALRLLGSAILSLLLLLLAPAMVLAPAFGESGRMLFRKWLTALLGAVVSKLVCSFLLGATLGVLAILARLQALGWWTQWLLMSMFWWGAFTRRHHALGAAGATIVRDRRRAGASARRVTGALDLYRQRALSRWYRDRRSKPAEEVKPRDDPAPAPRRTPGGRYSGGRLPEGGPSGNASPPIEDASHTVADSPGAHRKGRRARGGEAQAEQDVEQQLSAKRAQLVRVRHAHRQALVDGERRRAATLASRAERIAGEIERYEARHEAIPREPHGANVLRADAGERRLAAEPPARGRQNAGMQRGGAPRAAAADRDGRGHASEVREEIDRELEQRRQRIGSPREQSSVMRDARAVAERRKRQLGKDRP